LPSVRENLSVLTSRAGFMAEHVFFREPGNQHPDGRHVLLGRWRRGLALKCFDVGGHRDRLNIFEMLVTGTLSPGQELVNCPVISGSRVRVADRDGKKFKELFPG
jgi:hypothetical protein